jgi:FSR family fosmidomycin resistance protein-like MFS transporter
LGQLKSFFSNRRLVTLALGHFTVDSYVGLLPVLFPLLIHKFSLNLETVGLVALAYSGMGAVSQPVFGLIADRWGTRFTGFALAWTAATFAAAGFAPTFPVLVFVAFLSGVGSGAFHPLGAVTVRSLLPPRGVNMAMSIYVTAGTVGLAAGPLIGVVAFGWLGVQGTIVMLVPGLAIAAYLVLAMRAGTYGDVRSSARRSAVRRVVPMIPLLATIGMMASRSWTTVALQAFTPTWYQQLGFQPWFYGPLATTIILASAVGAVGTGALADRFGRRAVIMGTLVLSVPAVWLVVAFPGYQGFLWALLVGGLAASTAPLMLVLAQELLAARAGFASGLIMGLGFVTGAIGVPVTGAIADRFGLQTALYAQVLVVVLTIPVALLLPSERFLAQLRDSGHAAPERKVELAAVGGGGS